MNSTGKMEFHISRQARDRYQFDEVLFSQSGNVIFANFHAARVFAQNMNLKRDLLHFPEQAVRAGQINAMGLIDEIFHLVVDQYRQQRSPEVMRAALDWLVDRLGQEAVDGLLRAFAREFPPVSVYRREVSPEAYLEMQTEGTPNRQILLEELLMLWLANANPAFGPFLELFDDQALEKETVYSQAITSLHEFFDTQPLFGPDRQNLVDMLRSPAIAVPYSLPGQLEYIRTRWGTLLGRLLYRLLTSLDLIQEEEKAIFLGPGPASVYEYLGTELEFEAERFSPDREWMPQVVLIAKNSYVWLDQLSRQYGRAIDRLDGIPDEELDRLSRAGFSGLWLIGLWERSPASKTIKQLRGNPEAVASAYSLFSYDIAADLGGEEAYRNLSHRAWQRGIRLSSDMVPNHMGIDSRWVIEHPDWFIQLDYSPFPSYSFNGPNLSWDGNVGIYIEDHYFDNTDAAVVFKRVDFPTGRDRYIYHGNDGTSFAWNDTAQLNYLLPEVREAVIQTILHVARKFPIIRFDAAMTLAKKHFQRLWFPEPGTGGAIPSRAEHGMTREQFDAAFPVEFWREVVDRVAQEVPDTLLLAEAFWLMEGYFVRTLGMHRVYNSAFMNMLRDEKNAEYRLVMKNTLEFDPEILKRYVNFMNNPDERTAVDQFGKDDKYFGVCTLLATMPGLPMFGHGQIEGFTERYGMEYRRAYWDEQPDPYLVERHEREIFPLLQRRYLFAEVKDFLLYDFYAPEGHVNEDVFAYSNRSGDERSLVVYNNKFSQARGWIRTSAAYFVKKDGAERSLEQRTLGEGLGIRDDPDTYTIFRDHREGLEYIRSNRELIDGGLYVELGAYKCRVFLDFRQVQDDQWRQYAQLNSYLNGRGVPSIEAALRELFLQPIHYAFRELVNAGFFQWAIDHRSNVRTFKRSNVLTVLDEAEGKTVNLIGEIRRTAQGGTPLAGAAPGSGDELSEQAIASDIRRKLVAILELPALGGLAAEGPEASSDKFSRAIEYLLNGPDGVSAQPESQASTQSNAQASTLSNAQASTQSKSHSTLESGSPRIWGTLLGWLFIHDLGRAVSPARGTTASRSGTSASRSVAAEISRSWIDEWLLGSLTAGALQDLGLNAGEAWGSVSIIKLLTSHRSLCAGVQPYAALSALLQDGEAQRFLGINRYQGVLWFNREAFRNLAWWIYTVSVVEALGEAGGIPAAAGETAKSLEACYAQVERLLKAEEVSGYQVEALLEAAKG